MPLRFLRSWELRCMWLLLLSIMVFYEECKMESNSQGGIEACVDYKIEESEK